VLVVRQVLQEQELLLLLLVHQVLLAVMAAQAVTPRSVL
jgi:hypothetical protein